MEDYLHAINNFHIGEKVTYDYFFATEIIGYVVGFHEAEFLIKIQMTDDQGNRLNRYRFVAPSQVHKIPRGGSRSIQNSHQFPSSYALRGGRSKRKTRKSRKTRKTQRRN